MHKGQTVQLQLIHDKSLKGQIISRNGVEMSCLILPSLKFILKVHYTYFSFGDTSKRHQIPVGTFYLKFLALVGIKFYKSDRCSPQKSKGKEEKKNPQMVLLSH